MTLLIWQDDMDTGIDIIDGQHRRIVEMINHLHITQKSMERFAVGEVIDELVDYTLSHFAFEEELMEEAGYPFSAAHKRVHEVFTKRVSEYRLRFEAGEDIVDDLRSMLSRWLFNHIRGDDKAYAPQVKLHLNQFAAYRNWLVRIKAKHRMRCRQHPFWRNQRAVYAYIVKRRQRRKFCFRSKILLCRLIMTNNNS